MFKDMVFGVVTISLLILLGIHIAQTNRARAQIEEMEKELTIKDAQLLEREVWETIEEGKETLHLIGVEVGGK